MISGRTPRIMKSAEEQIKKNGTISTTNQVSTTYNQGKYNTFHAYFIINKLSSNRKMYLKRF